VRHRRGGSFSPLPWRSGGVISAVQWKWSHVYIGGEAKQIATTTPTRPISPEEYLSDVHKDWDGDWEGDFDYLEGTLRRHDWGDYAHALMHSQLLAALPKIDFGSRTCVLPSLTISDHANEIPCAGYSDLRYARA
jgi:hypothetical protein